MASFFGDFILRASYENISVKSVRFSVEGIQKGYLFCQSGIQKDKGLTIGAELPRIELCSEPATPTPDTPARVEVPLFCRSIVFESCLRVIAFTKGCLFGYASNCVVHVIRQPWSQGFPSRPGNEVGDEGPFQIFFCALLVSGINFI